MAFLLAPTVASAGSDYRTTGDCTYAYTGTGPNTTQVVLRVVATTQTDGPTGLVTTTADCYVWTTNHDSVGVRSSTLASTGMAASSGVIALTALAKCYRITAQWAWSVNSGGPLPGSDSHTATFSDPDGCKPPCDLRPLPPPDCQAGPATTPAALDQGDQR